MSWFRCRAGHQCNQRYVVDYCTDGGIRRFRSHRGAVTRNGRGLLARTFPIRSGERTRSATLPAQALVARLNQCTKGFFGENFTNLGQPVSPAVLHLK